MFRDKIYFTVNGQMVELGGKDVFFPLSYTLRYHLQKTGTKVVCAEGDCGACTVMLSRVNQPGFRSINSCIYPTFSVDGCHLVTVEGLAQEGGVLSEIQNSMVRNFGGQCGFCTPGFVMSITNMYEQKTQPSEQNVKNYLTGNLCRCTGYQPIIQAALDVNAKKLKRVADLYPLKKETLELKNIIKKSVMIETPERAFFAPKNLSEATKYKRQYPKVRIYSGSTDIGVQINKGKDPGSQAISLHLIDELYEVSEKAGKIYVGARVTLDTLQKALEKSVPAFDRFMNIFASPQIKNSATLVGNLANGSPIADTTPFLMAVDADVHFIGAKGKRVLPVTKFFKGYKSFNMKADEFITGLSWKNPHTKAKVGLYKISQRRDLDISCVNTCFIVTEKAGVIEEALVALGGVGPVPLRLLEVEKKMRGLSLDEVGVKKIQKLLSVSIEPVSDLRGSAEFRRLMVQQLFAKYVQENFER